MKQGLSYPGVAVSEVTNRSQERSGNVKATRCYLGRYSIQKSVLAARSLTILFNLQMSRFVTRDQFSKDTVSPYHKSMQTQILQDQHRAVTGMEACLHLAREFVFWPGIAAHRNHIFNCQSCVMFASAQWEGPLIDNDIPVGPWQPVG